MKASHLLDQTYRDSELCLLLTKAQVEAIELVLVSNRKGFMSRIRNFNVSKDKCHLYNPSSRYRFALCGYALDVNEMFPLSQILSLNSEDVRRSPYGLIVVLSKIECQDCLGRL